MKIISLEQFTATIDDVVTAISEDGEEFVVQVNGRDAMRVMPVVATTAIEPEIRQAHIDLANIVREIGEMNQPYFPESDEEIMEMANEEVHEYRREQRELRERAARNQV